jgi:hypothetical protein
MDPISNTGRITQILRQRLLDNAKKLGAGKSDAGAGAARSDTLWALAQTEGLPNRQLKRALVQSILDEQFGPEVAGEARFQQVIDRVTDALEADPDTEKLLTRITSDLKAVAKR